MADSIFGAVLSGLRTYLARTMAAQGVAQLCYHNFSLLMTFYLAWKRGFSRVEMVSPKADAAFVAALRKRIAVS
jgi:lysophospholipid acyltransferase (LPLAT)-like uncharacterized protein